MLIFARTIFYQFFFVFVLVSLLFIRYPLYFGPKLMVLHMSYLNHFHPVKFEDAYDTLKSWGRMKAWSLHDSPQDFEIIEDAFAAEEFYWYKYSYTNARGLKVVGIDCFRIRWKPWEYYYEDIETVEMIEEGQKQMLKPTLNSIETDKAFRLMLEAKELHRQKMVT